MPQDFNEVMEWLEESQDPQQYIDILVALHDSLQRTEVSPVDEDERDAEEVEEGVEITQEWLDRAVVALDLAIDRLTD